MKKCLYVFFVLLLAVSWFNVSYGVGATNYGDSGCVLNALYSVTTGKPCATDRTAGCMPGYAFSPLTGKSCVEQTSVAGCYYSGQKFSVTSGKTCPAPVLSFSLNTSPALTLSNSTPVLVFENPLSQSYISLLSPNGGESWIKGQTQKIEWKDNLIVPCSHFGCDTRAYEITLVSASGVGRTVVKGVSGNSYNWYVGQRIPAEYSDEESMTPDGQYKIQVCISGTSTCDMSDAPFTVRSPRVAP